MNKQTLFVTLTTAALMCGCQSSKVKISGRFVGGDAKNIYLEQVLPLTQSVVDSAALAPDGSYRMELTGVAKTPSLYNVIYDGERIPLLLAGGDRLTLGSVGSVIRNYTVEGSSESELLRQFYQAFVTGAQQLENMGTEFARKLTDEERKSLIKEYTAEYYRIRREQLRFIIEHKASLAAVYALYQRLPGDTYLFNGDSDVVYYRTVAEALQESYPESPYLQSLQAEIARMDARISLTSQITEARHPDLELTDIYGKKIRLSSLAGKVVLLDFWSAELGSSNALNADLKELYRKYADAPVGFEVYQVAVDTSKPLWITAVQEQQLPWISVSDLRGRSSVALGLYNVQRLPANFLIDKEGTIVAKNTSYAHSLIPDLNAGNSDGVTANSKNINELARRSKKGGIFFFLALPAALTVYFIAIYAGAAMGAEWALNNPTYTHMNSWFHYAKLYAATAGCIGFMMLKYKWSIGKTQWFKVFPFVIVAINILIAVGSDFESGIRGAMALAETGDRWWLSSENVWLYGGWWNWVNGIAGILNILCMTGWWGIYSSKKHDDMLWPDMTWLFIIAYDLWNFEYTYNNLPTHAWYCGLALLLAPTFANALWNKGGWIQNRANTLALWCMFAQVFPLFQDASVFTTIPVLYADGFMDAAVRPSAADPTMQGVVAILALAANVIVLAVIIKRSLAQKKNPYTGEIFTDTRDFRLAMARAEGK